MNERELNQNSPESIINSFRNDNLLGDTSYATRASQMYRAAGHPELAAHLEEFERLRTQLGVPELIVPSEFDFSGKTIMVTGGASGIGKETVRQFAQAGGNVISFDINGPMLEVATDSILGEKPRGSINMHVVDISKQEQWQPIIDRIPKIDVLCNVAAIIDPPLDPSNPESQPNLQSLMELMDTLEGQRRVEDDLQKVFNVNFMAPYLLSFAVARKMTKDVVPALADDQEAKKHRNGSIIHVGSTNVYTHNDRRMAYAPLKAALHSLTEMMAVSLAPFGVRVNCVAPGATSNTAVVREELTAQRRMPLGISQPSHVARAILLFASDQAENTTGEIFKVDGGRTL